MSYYRDMRVARPSVFAANSMYLLAAAGLIGLGFAAAGIRALMPSANEATLEFNATAAYSVMLMLLPALMYWRRHPDINWAMRIDRCSVKHALVAVASAIVGVYLMDCLVTLWMVLLEAMGGHLQSESTYEIGAGFGGLMIALLNMALIPAVCEEFLFRGVMLSAYERNGSARAVALTALLFALMHGSLTAFPAQLLTGLVLGYLVVNTDSLMVPILYHFAHNATIVALSRNAGEGIDYAAGFYHEIGGMAGVIRTGIVMFVLAVIYGMLMLMASSEREASGAPFGIPRPMRPQAWGWRASLVMMSAIVTVAMMMGLSVWQVFGWAL